MKSITEVVQNLLKPYIDRNIETATGVLGAKNLLPNEGTSQTYRGITFTFLTDGSIVATGTADSANNAELKFADLSGREIASRNKTYILTGCPSGGNGKYNINIAIHRRSSGVFIREIDDVGNGAEFTLGNDEVIKSAFVKIGKGETVNNLVFAPMIRPASIADDTYVPYAMTNRELTKLNTIKTITLSNTWYQGFQIEGEGLVAYFPMPIGAKNLTYSFSEIKVFIGGSWYQVTYSGHSMTTGNLKISLSTPSGVTMSNYNGKALLISFTGSISFY